MKYNTNYIPCKTCIKTYIKTFFKNLQKSSETVQCSTCRSVVIKKDDNKLYEGKKTRDVGTQTERIH